MVLKIDYSLLGLRFTVIQKSRVGSKPVCSILFGLCHAGSFVCFVHFAVLIHSFYF